MLGESIGAYLAAHAGKIPFLMAAGPTGVHISMQRVLEAAVIGAVMLIGGYVAIIPRLEERITIEVAHIRSDIQRIETKVEQNDVARQQDYRDLTGKVPHPSR